MQLPKQASHLVSLESTSVLGYGYMNHKFKFLSIKCGVLCSLNRAVRHFGFGLETLNTPNKVTFLIFSTGDIMTTHVSCRMAHTVLFTCRLLLSCPQGFPMVEADRVFWRNTKADTVNQPYFTVAVLPGISTVLYGLPRQR